MTYIRFPGLFMLYLNCNGQWVVAFAWFGGEQYRLVKGWKRI